MNISAMTPAASALSAVHVPETKEGLGPDRDGDGDADDKSAISRQPVAATPSGMGVAVNTAA